MHPRRVTPNGSPHFLTLGEVAERLRLHPRTVRRLIARGELVAHRIGPQWRISEADFLTFTRQRRIDGSLSALSPEVHRIQ